MAPCVVRLEPHAVAAKQGAERVSQHLSLVIELATPRRGSTRHFHTRHRAAAAAHWAFRCGAAARMLAWPKSLQTVLQPFGAGSRFDNHRIAERHHEGQPRARR